MVTFYTNYTFFTSRLKNTDILKIKQCGDLMSALSYINSFNFKV